jgi:hypothetical protein
MPDRFSFPPQASADPLAEALRAIAGVTVVSVMPRYLPEGGRWVVELRCNSDGALAEALRVQRTHAIGFPDGEFLVVLQVNTDPDSLVRATTRASRP